VLDNTELSGNLDSQVPTVIEIQQPHGDHEDSPFLPPANHLEKSLTLDCTFRPVSGYLNLFVVVQYDGKSFPGKVMDIDEQQGDLQISCMHRVGRNRLFWPTRSDLCWYSI